MRNRVLALAVMLGAGTACNAILGIDEKVAVEAGVPDAGSFALTIAKQQARLVVGQDVSVDVTLERAGAFAGEVAVLVSGLPAGVSVELVTIGSGLTKGQLVFHASDSAVLGQATLSVIAASAIGLSAPISLTLIVQRAPGSLDMTFGVSGRVVPLPVGTTGQGLGLGGLLAAPDGSIFLCGQVRTATADSAVLLARLTVDGALDPSFGTGGIARVNSVGSVVDACNGAFLRPSGGVVFTGFSRPGASRDLMAARFSFTGHASGDFGSAGFITRAFGADSVGCCALAGTADAVIVGGSRADGPVLIRYLRNADLDTTFGPGSGIVILGPPGVGARWLAQQSTGHIVMALDSSPFRVLRFTPDGVPAGFADGEAAAIDVGGHGFSAASVALVKDGDGVITIGTATGDSGTKDIALEFLTSAGQVDRSVRANGWNVVHFEQGDSMVSSAALQPADGAFVVAGQSPTTDGPAFSVVRFAPDGAVDPTFGPGGRRSFEVNGIAQGIAIDPIGRIVVAGLAGNAADSSIVVYRLWP